MENESNLSLAEARKRVGLPEPKRQLLNPVADYDPLSKEIITEHGTLVRLQFDVDEEKRPAGGTISFFVENNGQYEQIGHFKFQDGPIGETGRNGGFVEDFMVGIYERLGWYNTGIYGCRENSLAITDTQSAENWLDRRTKGRRRRNVEGTHKL